MELNNYLVLLTKKLTSLITRAYIKVYEREFLGLPYLYEKNGFDSLMVVFSGFTGTNRRYNYVKSFKQMKCDKLFILDPWGHLGSYNLYENGHDYPMRITQDLVCHIVNGGGV